ncbi:MAG: sensor histidine kinase [Crocinitomicaceae bacterium]
MDGNPNSSFVSLGLFNIIILFFCLNTIHLRAQNEEQVMQMKNVIIKHSPFKASNENLNTLLNNFFAATQISIGVQMDSLFNIVNSESISLITKADSAIFYFNNAFYWLRHSEYDRAQEFYSKAGILFEQAHLELPNLYVKLHMANIQYYMKKVQYAYNEYAEILQNPLSDSILIGTMHHNMGAMLLELDSANFNSTDLKRREKSIDSISAHLDKAIEIYHALDYSRGYGATYSIYTNIKMLQEDYVGAQAMIDSCQSISVKYNDLGRIAFLRIKKASLLIRMKKYEAAADTANLAAVFFHEQGNFDQEEHALSAVYNAYYKNGKYKNATDVLWKMREVTTKRREKQLAEALSKYEVEFDTEKKNLTIKEQETQLESERLKTSNRNQLLVVLALLLVATFLGFMLFLQKRKRNAEKEKNDLILKSKAEGLKAVIEAEEKERKRIAADLHDGIVQQLGGLKLGLQNVLANNKSNESQRVIKILDEATTELRELSHQMMPRALGELGLIPALEDLFDKSLGLTKIQYQFEHFGLSERLPENIEIAIFRISQELINNVIRHSRAQLANMQLFKSGNFIVLIVEDNGKGFDDTQKDKGIGLMNISSRLDTINGQVNYEPSPESGTLVTIKIPIS